MNGRWTWAQLSQIWLMSSLTSSWNWSFIAPLPTWSDGRLCWCSESPSFTKTPVRWQCPLPHQTDLQLWSDWTLNLLQLVRASQYQPRKSQPESRFEEGHLCQNQWGPDSMVQVRLMSSSCHQAFWPQAMKRLDSPPTNPLVWYVPARWWEPCSPSLPCITRSERTVSPRRCSSSRASVCRSLVYFRGPFYWDW